MSPGVSIGPFRIAPTGQLTRHLADYRLSGPPRRQPDYPGEVAGWLFDTLSGCNVELGDYERLVVRSFGAGLDPELVHVIGAWVARGYIAGYRRGRDEVPRG